MFGTHIISNVPFLFLSSGPTVRRSDVEYRVKSMVKLPEGKFEANAEP